MMQPDNTIRIDQNITTPLAEVGIRFFRSSAFADFTQVSPPGFGAPDVPERRRKHSVAAVEFSLLINQQWPFQSRFRDVLVREKIGLKGDDRDFQVQVIEFVLPFTQLRDVPLAGKSAEVAVKNEQ